MAFFFWSDDAKPFFRIIQPEEYWLYNFPSTPSYYPSWLLWITVILVPTVTVGGFWILNRDVTDLIQGVLGANLSVFLAGSITNCLKLGVGRPRPDFLARCFPDGHIKDDMKCTGNIDIVIEGYKSFPSGHSSLSFSCMVYVSLYLAGKLHSFGKAGRGSGFKLCCVFLPIIWAIMIAVSRTADYHHHWQDVTVGSILGAVIASVCYRQYYPPVQRHDSHLPYKAIEYYSLPISQENTSLSPQFSVQNVKEELIKLR
ncbi:hypothetical protein CHS0354_003327 [Potamilus streckersoni]|uniref:Phosphatidic acid phosphatase type 2/haloperoxidase domain-containing protein n=1 Tax=Potamilus streckersoni TaxID=2493646 RepID=A0AAE0VPI7_9BIVA|nr:hypothetical protein CHS0354_003327 [Potamilus streckersoni]